MCVPIGIAALTWVGTTDAERRRLMFLDLSEIAVRKDMIVRQQVDQPRVEDPDLEFVSPLVGDLTFENSGDLLNISGEVDCAVTVPCARCLVEVEVPIHLDVEEHLPLVDVLNPTRELEPDEDPEIVIRTIIHLEQGRPILDLDELLRQWVVCELPMRTVCSEDCAGLCPTCGGNRNLDPCRCAEADRNMPFAALASLLGDTPDPPDS